MAVDVAVMMTAVVADVTTMAVAVAVTTVPVVEDGMMMAVVVAVMTTADRPEAIFSVVALVLSFRSADCF